MTTTGRRAADGDPPPPVVTNAASTPATACRAGCDPAGDHGVAPGGAERAEERHVSLVERLGTGELIAEPVEQPAASGGHAGGVGAQAVDILPHLLPVPDPGERVPPGGDQGAVG